MKRLILFSLPSPDMLEKIKTQLFPKNFEKKIFAYMPTDGTGPLTIKYMDYWKNYVEENKGEFVFIDITKRDEEAKLEAEKIMSSNILMMTGGNTFDLKNNLSKSEIDKTILEFVKKDDFVLAGFSAGAIMMTPNINAASQPAGTDPTDLADENNAGVTDFIGLNIIDFEVYPHYDITVDTKNLDNYREQTPNEVKPISDSEYIIIDL